MGILQYLDSQHEGRRSMPFQRCQCTISQIHWSNWGPFFPDVPCGQHALTLTIIRVARERRSTWYTHSCPIGSPDVKSRQDNRSLNLIDINLVSMSWTMTQILAPSVFVSRASIALLLSALPCCWVAGAPAAYQSVKENPAKRLKLK